jgi:L-ribulokinase
VLGKPVLVPERPVTSLGSAIIAGVAAGAFPSIEAAQKALCPPYRTVNPNPASHETYERLYGMYRKLYFALGDPASEAVSIGEILPALRAVAAETRAGS